MESADQIEEQLFGQTLDSLMARLSYDRRLERLWGLIKRDYENPDLGLAEAARESGISENHLNVLCRQATSFTFHQLLTRYRLLRAIAIMNTKNYSVLEIGLESGFGSLASVVSKN